MKVKPRNGRFRSASRLAATAVVIASAVGFFAALPTPARADGCSYTAGISCVVEVGPEPDQDPIWTGGWHGDLIEDDEGGDNGGGDPGEGDDPGSGTTPPPTVQPASTTTTTISPDAARKLRQLALLRERLERTRCFNLLFPTVPSATAVQNLANHISFVWKRGNLELWQAAAQYGIDDPLTAVMEFVALGPNTGTNQNLISVTHTETGLILGVPLAFWSDGVVLGLNANDYRTYLLLTYLTPGFTSATQAQILSQCFDIPPPAGTTR
jgi:hypothetical protein